MPNDTLEQLAMRAARADRLERLAATVAEGIAEIDRKLDLLAVGYRDADIRLAKLEEARDA